MKVMISAMRLLANGVMSVELASCDGSPLPAFDAGSHVDVHLPSGIIRQYSLWNHPDETHRYCIGVLKDPTSRGGSKSVHEQLRVGEIIDISEPRNLFPLDAAAKRSLLFAGGIGITPIYSMAQRLAQQGRDFELHYSARASDRAAFVQKLKTMPFADRVHFYFDEQQQALDATAVFSREDKAAHIYVCGPSGFMDFVLKSAADQGWPAEKLHKEYFAAAATQKADDGSFEVQIRSSEQVIHVAAQQTVVEALEQAGVCIPVSCEQGICGTCVTRIIDGVPDHRDYFLSVEEQAKNDQFTPCCSRAKSARLVLDL